MATLKGGVEEVVTEQVGAREDSSATTEMDLNKSGDSPTHALQVTSGKSDVYLNMDDRSLFTAQAQTRTMLGWKRKRNPNDGAETQTVTVGRKPNADAVQVSDVEGSSDIHAQAQFEESKRANAQVRRRTPPSFNLDKHDPM